MPRCHDLRARLMRLGVLEMEQVPTFCPPCVSRCGATATISDGAFVALAPDPEHPTGPALCIKGKAAPELVGHKDRLLHPLRRTNPKGTTDPGWRRITWDEALQEIAARLTDLARDPGPESVVFGSASPSTSAMSDSVDWLTRLRRAFGSPNLVASMELCGWGRYLAPLYTFGEPVPGAYLPDLDQAGCILYWGYNPSVARLAHATATTAALRRGARLIVVDPRRAGLASKADHWLRVRPGTDAALAIAMTHVMIERGWYDQDFVRRWTNAPLLVRGDNGHLVRADEVFPTGDPAQAAVTDTPSSRCARSISYLTCTLSAARKNPPWANSSAVTASARGCSSPSASNADSLLAWLTRLTSATHATSSRSKCRVFVAARVACSSAATGKGRTERRAI